jgi:transcription termination factor Rho
MNLRAVLNFSSREKNPLSDTTDVTSDVSNTDVSAPEENAGAARRRRAGSGLTAMLLPELQSMASSLGISGTARLRKGELIAAIQEQQNGDGRVPGPRNTGTDTPEAQSSNGARSQPDAASTERATSARRSSRGEQNASAETAEPQAERADAGSDRNGDRSASEQRGEREQRGDAGGERTNRRERNSSERGASERNSGERNSGERSNGDRAASERTHTDRVNGERVNNERVNGDRANSERGERSNGERSNGDRANADRNSNDRAGADRDNQRGENRNDQRGEGRNDRADNRGDSRTDSRSDNRADNRGDGRNDNRNDTRNDNRGDDDDEGGRRGRRSRFRDRNRRSGGRDRVDGGTVEPQVNEDDVLVPVAGIVDVLDNYAFVRTSGYLAGSNDVYVSMAQIKRYSLRRGDAVTGAVRAVRETPDGGRRDKYNPLVRLDTINGMELDESRNRPKFYDLTPLYPQDRLRLETEPNILTTRVIDLVMPIGKGQRALIVSPPKAGKTMVLQSIANAIAQNNPECHLMVVLVDERPEEVTDMQRSVKGEVIASTFDRPPTDHTTVAELSIERAKRLVELGHDVVVLLDSITRLGRAYNNSSPASGRILSGGIDSTALYPPKRFLGAARNIEHGGSLTIIATALVETGSTGDTVIFEEFKGTGNAELKLDRKIADKRVFPAIDIDPSSTRKEEILLAPDELAIVLKLRKVLHALDSQQALDLLLDRLKKTRTNIEFLMQIAQSTPGE